MLRAKQGDITSVTGFNAIVNPANNSLLGGGGINGMIHRAAGPQLKSECRRLNGCETGDSRLTLGYNLPCKYVIHTVGPVWNGGQAGEEELLASCYDSALKIALSEGIRKIAFPSISTGEYGYPIEEAARVAVKTVLTFMEENPDTIDEVCWIVPDAATAKAYNEEIKTAIPKEPKPKKTRKEVNQGDGVSGLPQADQGDVVSGAKSDSFDFTLDEIPICVNGRKYVCVKQYVLAQKALLFDDLETYKKIMQEMDSSKQDEPEKAIDGFDEEIWKTAENEVLYHAFVARCKADGEFKKALLKADDSALLKDEKNGAALVEVKRAVM